MPGRDLAFQNGPLIPAVAPFTSLFELASLLMSLPAVFAMAALRLP